MLILVESEELFDTTWLTDFDNPDRSRWVLDYYLPVLVSNDRYAFYKYEESYIDRWEEYQKDDPFMGNWYDWYDSDGLTEENYIYKMHDSLQITQTSITMGGLEGGQSFWITNIVRYENGVKITLVDDDDNIYPYLSNEVIPYPIDGSSFDVILVRDGDYLEMYLDTMDNHLATFVMVDKAFSIEIVRLLLTNECNFSHITSWPRRADGSTDYPPPAESPVAENQEEFPVEADPVPVAALPVPSEEAAPPSAEPAAPAAAVESRSLPWIAIAGALAACGIMAAVMLGRKRRKAGDGSAGQGA
jgi:hypothetical protein